MPHADETWRPLNNSEIEAAVKRIRALVDSGITPAAEDHTRNWHDEVVALFGDERGYIWHEYRRISDRLLLDHFLNDESIRYYRTFAYAGEATNQNGLLRLESIGWEKNLPILLRAVSYSATSDDQAIEIAKITATRLHQQAEAAKRLRARGFRIDVYASDIRMEPSGEAQLYSLLLSEAANRGGSWLFQMLKVILENSWRPEFQRYVINLNVHTSPHKTEPSRPFGYLYNVATKITSLGTEPSSPLLPDEDYLQLATDICALHAVEPYNPYQVALPSGGHLIDLLSDLAKLQFSFTLPQIDQRDVSRTLRGAFSWIETDAEARLGWNLDDAIALSEAVIEALPDKGAVRFAKSSLRGMLPHVGGEQFEALWRTFVHRPATVNACFCNPMAASTADAYFKPFIGLADGAVIGLSSVSAAGWYEAIVAALREAGVSNIEEQIGYAFESFVRECLAPYGTVYAGKFASNHGKGDVDAAIATDSTIILFELKRKSLTRLAQSGDVVKVLLDLIRSVVKAQAQLAKVEYVLRSDGQIDLGSQVLELRERKVKRIVLSWHDYGVFHDHGFLMNFLAKLAGATLTLPDTSKDDAISSINRGLSELADWTAKLNSLSAEGRRFENCFFYAIGHLLAMMRTSATDKTLCQHLTFNERLMNVGLDFYVEYGRWLREILPLLPAAE